MEMGGVHLGRVEPGQPTGAVFFIRRQMVETNQEQTDAQEACAEPLHGAEMFAQPEVSGKDSDEQLTQTQQRGLQPTQVFDSLEEGDARHEGDERQTNERPPGCADGGKGAIESEVGNEDGEAHHKQGVERDRGSRNFV